MCIKLNLLPTLRFVCGQDSCLYRLVITVWTLHKTRASAEVKRKHKWYFTCKKINIILLLSYYFCGFCRSCVYFCVCIYVKALSRLRVTFTFRAHFVRFSSLSLNIYCTTTVSKILSTYTIINYKSFHMTSQNFVYFQL